MHTTYDIQALNREIEERGTQKVIAEYLPQCSAVTLQALANAINEKDDSSMNVFFAELIRQMELHADEAVFENEVELSKQQHEQQQLNNDYESSVGVIYG